MDEFHCFHCQMDLHCELLFFLMDVHIGISDTFTRPHVYFHVIKKKKKKNQRHLLWLHDIEFPLIVKLEFSGKVIGMWILQSSKVWTNPGNERWFQPQHYCNPQMKKYIYTKSGSGANNTPLSNYNKKREKQKATTLLHKKFRSFFSPMRLHYEYRLFGKPV